MRSDLPCVQSEHFFLPLAERYGGPFLSPAGHSQAPKVAGFLCLYATTLFPLSDVIYYYWK